jgi:Gpi18-like mannosyltransferase
MINKYALKLTSKYFLILIGIVLLILSIQQTQLSTLHIFKVNYLGVDSVLNPFTFNDSEWYLHLAEFGYGNTPHLFAFFPFYPMLIRLFHMIGIPYEWGGFIISLSCFFSAGYLLCLLLPKNEKNIGLAIFFFSPIAIFNLSVYTESLFLFLCFLVWYLIKTDKYLPAGIALGLSMLTRNSAYFFAFFLFIRFLVKTTKSRDKKNLCQYITLFLPAIIISSIYPLYTLVTQGDIFMFMSVQGQNWSRERAHPLVTILIDIHKLFSEQFGIYTFSILINFLSIALVILLVIKFWNKHPDLLAFQVIVILAALSASLVSPIMPASMSLYRYIWGTFPIYLLLPKITYNLSKLSNLLLSSVYFFVLLLNIFSAFNKALLA